MAPPDLHPDYYLDHFHAVRTDVAARYEFLLDGEEKHYLATLAALGGDAARLYARLTNRRGPCFRIDRLDYPEIDCLQGAIAGLRAAGLLEDGACGDDAGDDLLACFTAPEIAAALRPTAAPRFSRRAGMLAWIATWDGRRALIETLLEATPVIRLCADDRWDFLRFLFFGERVANLSGFVVRALGHRVPEAVAAEAFAPRFASREAALDTYRMACRYDRFRALRAGVSAAGVLAWWRGEEVSRDALADPARAIFDRLCDRLGRLLERAGDVSAAAEVYAESPVPPCRERWVRLLVRSGQRERAAEILSRMGAAPATSEEAYAAAHLAARLDRRARRSPARDLHQSAPELVLDYDDKQVEAALLAHYRAAGWDGVHAEGWPWNAVFGLLLWDIIYDPSHGGFHQPLQLYPSDLHLPSFYSSRREAIEHRLARLGETEDALASLLACFAAKEGTTNPFVFWHPDVPAVVSRLVRAVPGDALAAVLRRMAEDYRRHRRGFPDLFLWRRDAYAFVEVKAEGDQLSAHQYQWLEFLRRQGIVVRLERVRRAASAKAAGPAPRSIRA